MKVLLEYFKPSGKWYSSGEMDLPRMELFEVWEIVEAAMKHRALPGLVLGHGDFTVLVDVPDHPNRHPRIIQHFMIRDNTWKQVPWRKANDRPPYGAIVCDKPTGWDDDQNVKHYGGYLIAESVKPDVLEYIIGLHNRSLEKS